MLSRCGKALSRCPLLLAPIFTMMNFRALDKRCPTVQSKGKTWDLTAGKRLQRLARRLWVESWCSPKNINHRIKKPRLLFLALCTEEVYDLLLLHSLYSPEGAFLEGISSSGHSQESLPPAATRDVWVTVLL